MYDIYAFKFMWKTSFLFYMHNRICTHARCLLPVFYSVSSRKIAPQVLLDIFGSHVGFPDRHFEAAIRKFKVFLLVYILFYILFILDIFDSG